MNLVKVEEKEPKVNEWYLVQCFDWNECGYTVAQWDGETWIDDQGREDFNDYVDSYFETPIEEFQQANYLQWTRLNTVIFKIDIENDNKRKDN